jgi:hypothetical protein
MDRKLVFPGGEPKIEWSDILLTQYSNYYGIHAGVKGADPENYGVNYGGCVVTGSFNNLDRECTVNISDGYLGIEGKMVKVQNTPSITFPVTFVEGAIRDYTIFALPVVSFNPKGDKTFLDGSAKQTWEQTRITLRADSLSTPQTGEIAVSTVSVTNNEEEISVTPQAVGIPETVVKTNKATEEEMKDRGSNETSIVTPKALFSSFSNFGFETIASFNKIAIEQPIGTRWDFILPEGTNVMFLQSAFAFAAPSITEYNKVGYDGNWTYNDTTRTLSVYWSIAASFFSSTAYALITLTKN